MSTFPFYYYALTLLNLYGYVSLIYFNRNDSPENLNKTTAKGCKPSIFGLQSLLKNVFA